MYIFVFESHIRPLPILPAPESVDFYPKGVVSCQAVVVHA